jgi:hypothetical protein
MMMKMMMMMMMCVCVDVDVCFYVSVDSSQNPGTNGKAEKLDAHYRITTQLGMMQITKNILELTILRHLGVGRTTKLN